nr:hypothetical protein GCM10020063_057860 [Dactylosporangium thailandense]
MFSRFTTDARAVIARLPSFATADARTTISPMDLAQALHAHRAGNAAAIWTDPWPAADLPPSPTETPFDPATKAVLEQSLRVALESGAEHIGTEHLLAALVRTSSAADWLAERGATREAVDELLTRLAGGTHLEKPAETPSAKDRREWKAARANLTGGKQPGLSPAYTIAIAVVALAVVLALCIWSGP